MKGKKRIKIFVFGILFFLVLHYVVGLDLIGSFPKLQPIIENATLSLAIICGVLVIRTFLDRLIDNMEQSDGEKYNLRRIVKLISGVVISLVIISFFFQKPYTTLAGLGLISLVLGFALQAPITSFIAWLYIVFRRPYKVGDRIQIADHKGDVVEVSYLDTIIREFSGDYLENDRMSGRLIYFPNSLILTGRVINYSGTFQPFIWNETAIQIAYSSDLDFVELCLKNAVIEDFKEHHPNISLKGNEPDVYFRVNNYAWLEAVVSYPVEPKDTTGRRNRILRLALPMLNAAPDKVGFPEGSKR